MSIGLLFPAALAALAALALPLLIHLTRRSERQLMTFAALRWLRAKERARRRVRIDEWRLLALRLLLLAAVAMLLAQPVWVGARNERPWVVVVPGADSAAHANDPALRDAEWHWLAPGFPAFASAAPRSPTEAASLLRELDATLAPTQPLAVIVPDHLTGLDAERIVLSRHVDWRIAATRAPVTTEPAASEPQQVAIRHDADHAAISRYFSAAANAWNAGSEVPGDDPVQQPFAIDSAAIDPATADVALSAGTDWLLWLSAEALPPAIERWLAEGGTVLRTAETASASDDRAVEVWRSTRTGASLSAQRNGMGRLLILHGAQLPERLEPEFPALLHGWLSAPARGPDQALAQHVAPTTGIPAWPAASTPLDDLLIWLIAALWLIERLLASARRKASRA